MAVTNTITISIYVLSHLLHVLGFCLLIRIKKADTFGAAQRLFLLNLSLVEAIYAALAIFEEVTLQHENLAKAKFSTVLILDGFFYVWYILVMIGLTFDRFLTLYLKLRYVTVWQIKKTKMVLATCFLLALISAIVLLCTHSDVDALYSSMTLYLWPLLNILFLLVAFGTYGYLARTAFKQNRIIGPAKGLTESIDHENSHTEQQQTRGTISRKTADSSFSIRKMKRGFIVPSLLITSFMVCWLIPDFVYFGYEVSDIELEYDSYVDLLYPIGVLTDAIIYILCWKDTRKELKKIFTRCFNKR